MPMTDSFDWKSIYDGAHSTFPASKPQPVIGITGNFGDKGCELAEGYYRSVIEAGATPVVLPPTDDLDTLCSMLDSANFINEHLFSSVVV